MLKGQLARYLAVVGDLKQSAASLKDSTFTKEAINETRLFLTKASTENEQLAAIHSPARSSTSRLLELTTRFTLENRTAELSGQLAAVQSRLSDLTSTHSALADLMKTTRDRWTAQK